MYVKYNMNKIHTLVWEWRNMKHDEKSAIKGNKAITSLMLNKTVGRLKVYVCHLHASQKLQSSTDRRG